ncbi:MAG: thioredoxin domain-containing protein [Chloroflexi bacterium]|nr:thioredoxin domain-containing protein [Chloroflexota bacterium]
MRRNLIGLTGLLLVTVLALSWGGNVTSAVQTTPTSTPAQDYTPLPGHTLGPEDAPVTIVMYGDFQCELCARYARDLAELIDRYPGELRLIWRHLPDPDTHDKAALALQASEAAAVQGRFWEMHDQLFAHLPEWATLTPDEFRAELSAYAAVVGLDVARFEAELDAGTYAWMVEAARRDAANLDIVGVPQLLFNGIPYTGRDDLFGLEDAVRLELLTARQFDAPPPMTIDLSRSYRATIVTQQGDIVLDLFPRDAPQAVNNFVFLARAGWYDDMTFFYVVPGFLAQTGDPSDTGRGSPGYTIPDEHTNGLIFDREGLVAMSHPVGVPESAGSQFFITLAPLQTLGDWNGQYTIFGLVIDGLDVVRNLTPRNPNDPINFPNPPPGDRVITITIEEF